MKKILALLTILAAFGIGGVSNAFAGNCTNIHSNQPWRDNGTGGKPAKFVAAVGSCTGVDKVQYGGSYPDQTGGIGDQTMGQNYWAYAAGPTVPTNGSFLQPTCSGCAVTSVTYWVGDPCDPYVQRYVSSGFWYRIESVDIHGVKTWGPWHFVAQDAPSWMSPCSGV